MPDAPCYMLDASLLQKDAKKRFQKKFSTKVGGKSGPKVWSWHFGRKESSKDARCEQARFSMLHATCSIQPCYKQMPKQAFRKSSQQKQVEKVVQKVIFMLCGESSHQKMPDANKLDTRCSMLDAQCNHATNRCKNKLSEKVLNKSRWKNSTQKCAFDAFASKSVLLGSILQQKCAIPGHLIPYHPATPPFCLLFPRQALKKVCFQKLAFFGRSCQNNFAKTTSSDTEETCNPTFLCFFAEVVQKLVLLCRSFQKKCAETTSSDTFETCNPTFFASFFSESVQKLELFTVIVKKTVPKPRHLIPLNPATLPFLLLFVVESVQKLVLFLHNLSKKLCQTRSFDINSNLHPTFFANFSFLFSSFFFLFPSFFPPFSLLFCLFLPFSRHFPFFFPRKFTNSFCLFMFLSHSFETEAGPSRLVNFLVD